MRKLIIAGLMAATMMPSLVLAQEDRREERRDQRDDRRDDRSDRRDDHRGNRDGRREYRQDFREAQRDWGRDDWRRYRDQNRDIYRGAGWRSDFRYQAFRPGIRIALPFYAPRYVIGDYGRYHLPRPGFNQRWVRHFNDVLLVDTRSGIVVDVFRNFYL